MINIRLLQRNIERRFGLINRPEKLVDLSRQASPLLLAKGKSITLTDATSVVIRCQIGSLWVTQNNDVRDVVVETGGEFRPDRKGPVVVYALAASRVSWAPAGPQPTPAWKAFCGSIIERLVSSVSSVSSRHPAIE
jgi:hypothetical protein